MSRCRTAALALVCATVATLAIDSTPAAASGGFPDVKIAKRKAGPYKGNDVYTSESGAIPRVKRRADVGDVRSFFVKAENDGVSVEEFDVHGSINSALSAKYRFFRGGTDITEAVIGPDGYAIDLEPDKVVRFRIRLKLKAGGPDLHQDELSLVDPSGTDYDVVGYDVAMT